MTVLSRWRPPQFQVTRFPFASLLALALGLAFQGSRGVWEPDEGYYANVAVGMLRSGDWFTPRLYDLIFLDKPPLQYWSMATGMALLGVNEWGVRLANAIWFAGTVLVVELLGRRLWDSSTGRLAALLYATTLLPFLATNVLTPDTTLAFWAACGAYCYVMASGLVPGGHRGRWWLALGFSTGLGILTKGPAILIFLVPLATEFLLREKRRAFSGVWPYVAVLVATVIGGLWYVPVIIGIPGAGAYFLDSQVIGRLFTASYHRNAGIFGGLVVYLPALVLGSLPWSALWPSLAKRLCRKPGGEGHLRHFMRRPRGMLLALWFGIPLAILFAARSRLPLYVLPLFAPLALGTARAFPSIRADARRRRLLLAFVVVWSSCLVILKASADRMCPDRNAGLLARQLRPLLPDQTLEVITVDRRLNALPVYGYDRAEWVTLERDHYPFFSTVETLEEELAENRQERGPFGFIVPERGLERFSELLAGSGLGCRRLGNLPGSVVILCGQDGRPGVPLHEAVSPALGSRGTLKGMPRRPPKEAP